MPTEIDGLDDTRGPNYCRELELRERWARVTLTCPGCGYLMDVEISTHAPPGMSPEGSDGDPCKEVPE